MTISIYTPRGNINTVLEIQIHTLSECLNTTEIEEHTHKPSGYIDTVPISLTRMPSDNLRICAINKYTNMLGDDGHTVAI